MLIKPEGRQGFVFFTPKLSYVDDLQGEVGTKILKKFLPDGSVTIIEERNQEGRRLVDMAIF